MAIPSKKADPVKLFLRRLGLLALFVVLLLALSAVWDVYHKERESRVLRDQAEAELKDLSDQQAHLNAEIGRLQTVRGREEALREQYQMGKQGENMIVIVDPPKATPAQATTTTLRSWLHGFFPFW